MLAQIFSDFVGETSSLIPKYFSALKASDSLLNNAQVFEYNPAGTLLDQWLKKLPLGSKTSEITELLNKFPVQSAPVLMYYYGGM